MKKLIYILLALVIIVGMFSSLGSVISAQNGVGAKLEYDPTTNNTIKYTNETESTNEKVTLKFRENLSRNALSSTSSNQGGALVYVVLNENTLTLKSGSIYQLTATVMNSSDSSVNWSSSDDTVATVSQTGIVTAANGGTAIIYCEANESGWISTCTVTVTDSNDLEVNLEYHPTNNNSLNFIIPDNAPYYCPANDHGDDACYWQVNGSGVSMANGYTQKVVTDNFYVMELKLYDKINRGFGGDVIFNGVKLTWKKTNSFNELGYNECATYDDSSVLIMKVVFYCVQVATISPYSIDETDTFVQNPYYTGWYIPGEIVTVYTGDEQLSHLDFCSSDQVSTFTTVNSSYTFTMPSENVICYAHITGHLYNDDNICEICGWEMPLEKGSCGNNVFWELGIGGTLNIFGSGIAISSPWNDYKSFIRTVIIHEGITETAKSMFSECINLSEVLLPETLKTISEDTFNGCVKLKTLSLPNGLEKIGLSAFNNCDSLEVLIIPKDITSIDRNAFSNCDSLKKVILPKNISAFGYQVFYNSKVKEIEILDFTEALGSNIYNSFDYLFLLEKITVDNNNPNYSSKDGVLYNKDKTDLIYYPRAKTNDTFEIPNSVANILPYAFYNNKCLKKVCIPSSVKKISNSSFSAASKLKDVIIPESVLTIGTDAFNACLSIKNVFYAGDSELWSFITINTGNDYLTKASIHFNTTNHIPGETVKENEIAATCLITGHFDEVTYCSVCRIEISRETKTIAKLSHTEKTIPLIAATCTKSGYTEGKICSVCGEVLVAQQAIPATGHIHETISAVPATCTSTGLTEGVKCSDCGEILAAPAPIAALGHNYQLDVTNPTCTKSGYTTYTCTRCNDTYTSNLTQPLGHIYDTGVVTKVSTYTATGVKTFTCTVCGETKTETIPMKQTPTVAQVTGLKTTKQTTKSITLTWSKAKNAKKYIVYRSTDGKKWTKVATVTKNTYTDKKLSAGKTYQYKVKGYHTDSKTSGKFSAVLKTGTITAAPTVALKSGKSKTATATWKKVTGAKKYIVYKSTDNKKWTKVTTTTKNTYTLTKLTGGKKIYVKVIAVNAYGKNSAASAVKSVTVKK